MKDRKIILMPDVDFGDDDASVSLAEDTQFDAWIAGVAPSINAPPATPRAEMWDTIAARTPALQPQSIRLATIRHARWVWPAAIAAALLAGVGIDRVITHREPVVAPSAPPMATAKTPVANDPARLYKLAAVQTLSQAEALLTAYRATDAATHDPVATRQLGAWGRQVLASTRLLLDSPAGDDPQLRDLLDDLELVLVQIIRSSGTELNADERALIVHAMKDRNLLPRIRTAVPAGAPSAATE